MKPIAFTKLCDVPVINNVCMEYVLMRSNLEMAQICKGLDTNKVFSLMKSHPVATKNLFVFNDLPLSAKKLLELLTPEFSPRGSNRRELEEAVIMNWNDYVRNLEGI